MTPAMTRWAVLPATAALLVALTACGGDETRAEGGKDGQDAEGGTEQELGPLDAYFEEIYGGQDQESADAQMKRVEEITADCMAEQGFEYLPVDYSSQSQPVAVDDELDWGSEEFVKEYGYGITTQPGSGEEMPEPDLEAEEWVDPNQEYVEAMTEGEREAYYRALYGEQSEVVEGEEVEYDWTTAGCQGRASHEVYEAGMETEQTASLQEEMQRMWEAAEADPRLAETSEAWASCMADAGFSGYAKVGDPEMQLSEKSNAIYEEVYGDGSEPVTEESYEEVEAEVQRRIAELNEEEVEIAVADHACREEIGYDDIYQEVHFEHQQDFVDAHKAELEAWVEAAKAARG